MSEIQTESPEVEDTAQEPQDGPQEPEKIEEAGQDEQEVAPRSKAAREAARYRVRAKEAEGQVETLTAQVDALRRQIVETHLDGLDAGAFWKLHGDQLDGLLDEDGRINPDAVAAQVSELRDSYGLPRRPRGPVVATEGKSPDQATPPRRTLADAFSSDPNRRRA